MMPHAPLRFEQGRYGRRAILSSGWSDQLIEYLVSNDVVELELNQAKGWIGQDLSFLEKLAGLKSFEIFDLGIREIGPIHSLHNLKRLGVTTYCSTGIDFSAFPELESCGLEWRSKAGSLFECVTLKELFLNRYSGKDTASFGKLANLESLSILNCARGKPAWVGRPRGPSIFAARQFEATRLPRGHRETGQP